MTVSRPVRRLAALGLLFASCWGIVSLFALPLVASISQENARAAAFRLMLSHYLDLGATLPALQHELEVLSGLVDDKSFLQRKSSALMSAEMQSVAQGLVASAGAILRSSRSLPLAQEESFERVSVELELGASTAALIKLLYSIETAEPTILITHLAVQVPETEAGVGLAEQPLLNVGMRLNSYARPSSKGGAL
jgi:hypothetical protein